MKKISVVLFLLLAISSQLFSQGFQLSAFGSGKSTWLFNKTISDIGDEQNYTAGWGYNYGLGVNYFFTEHIACEIDFLLNSHSGNYKGSIPQFGSAAVNTYESNIKLSTFDIPILFRFHSSSSYIEIGPQYSVVSKAVYNSTGTGIASITNYDIKPVTAQSYISGVFGFGIEVPVSDHFFIRTGLRFEYGFTDLKGVDAMGNDLRNPFFYTKVNPTNSAAAGLLLGVSYSFGASEGRGKKNNNVGLPPPPPNIH